MPIWLERLLAHGGTPGEVRESAMHEWAEFNLPTRDNLEALFRAEDDQDAIGKRASDRA
jgi:hypothetical protein